MSPVESKIDVMVPHPSTQMEEGPCYYYVSQNILLLFLKIRKILNNESKTFKLIHSLTQLVFIKLFLNTRNYAMHNYVWNIIMNKKSIAVPVELTD